LNSQIETATNDHPEIKKNKKKKSTSQNGENSVSEVEVPQKRKKRKNLDVRSNNYPVVEKPKKKQKKKQEDTAGSSISKDAYDFTTDFVQDGPGVTDESQEEPKKKKKKKKLETVTLS